MSETRPFRGAVFDVDGVLVDSPHELAWREAFRALVESNWRDVREQTTWTPERFTPAVHQEVMAGRPRMDPALPTEVEELRFSVHYRGQRVHVELAEDRITLAVRPGGTTPVHLLVHEQPVEPAPGQEREPALERTP